MTDFLNNLWVAVSTPNPALVKVLSIPLAFIESSLTLYLITSIFSFKAEKKEKILYIVSAALISLISMFFLKSPINLIFNYISSFIIIYLIFKRNIIKTVISGLLPSFNIYNCSKSFI